MSQNDYYFRNCCRMCLSKNIQEVIKLKPTPPGNNFLAKDEIGSLEPSYPLDLYFCNDCFHLQLGHVVKPEILYQNNYSYVSATSGQFLKHLEDYANYAVRKFSLGHGARVIDIGSNDGSCLKFFKKLGMDVLGVDPAENIAEIARQNGVPTIADFFSLEVAKRIKGEYGEAAFITSHNACAHIDNLDSVVEGVNHLLADDGIFSLEVGYLFDVFSNTWFDTIYHEHLDYHSVAPFVSLFGRFDMELVSVERVSPQGGSIRVMAQKKGGGHIKDKSVDELIKLEKDAGLHDAQTFKVFENKINTVRDKLKILIKTLKKQNKTIAGFGAPTKATTLMHHFGLGSDELLFIVDDNPLKQGLYTPGTHIPVLSSDAIYEKKPDYLLILAWNFAAPIMEKHEKFLGQGEGFIVPMPEPQIIN